MNRTRLFVSTAVLLVGLGGLALLWTAPTHASSALNRKATVRLYSEGNVVATWEADGPGRMEGPSYVFTVARGSQRLEVRISGTFSVEEKR